MVTNWATSFSHNKNRGFRRFLVLSYHFVFFGCPIIGNFLKIAFFEKEKGCKNWVFQILCFKFIFWKFSFLGLLKYYKNRGFSRFLCFCYWKIRKRQKNDNWNFWIRVSFPKMAVSWRTSVFQKTLLKPLFLYCFWVHAFWAKVSKNEILDAHQKREKIDW